MFCVRKDQVKSLREEHYGNAKQLHKGSSLYISSRAHD